jgi:hypothetical protein
MQTITNQNSAGVAPLNAMNSQQNAQNAVANLPGNNRKVTDKNESVS